MVEDAVHRRLLPSAQATERLLTLHVTTLCAHKLALDKPQYRALLTLTLHPNATHAKEFVQEDATRFRAEMRSFNPTYNPRLGREGGYGMSMPRNATPIRRCGEGPSPAWVEAPHATR